MKELNKTSVDVKEESNEMPTSEPSQNQIIDGLAQRVIALDKKNAQLNLEISNLENNVAVLEAELTKAKETNKKLSEDNAELQDKIEHLDEINEELVALLEAVEEAEEDDDLNPEDYKACEMPIKDEGYSKSWDKKVVELHSHLEGEKTYYESQIKLLKHELIEFPQRKAIIEKKLKCNTQHLKHVNRIIKAVLK